jgi:hypothetical protein
MQCRKLKDEDSHETESEEKETSNNYRKKMKRGEVTTGVMRG